MIVVTEAPRSTALTSLARLRRELSLERDDTTQDERLTDLMEEASADIIAYCQQPLIRQTVTESLPGYGRTVALLSVTPVPYGGISAVRLRGDAISPSGYSVSSSEAGMVFKADRWEETRQLTQTISADIAIMPGNPDWEFDYSGGYLLPGDDLLVLGVVVDAALHQFQISSDTFPILVSGEFVTVRGTVNNNGRHRVVARTTTTLTVASALTDEVIPSGTVSFDCRTLPRDLESLAVREIKMRYLSQYRDPTITSERLGDWSADYIGKKIVAGSISDGGLDSAVAQGLAKYIRVD